MYIFVNVESVYHMGIDLQLHMPNTYIHHPSSSRYKVALDRAQKKSEEIPKTPQA